jgi:steroid delta-isomerase-like uncharacterized protein
MATPQENNNALDKVYDALNNHDPAGVAALATPDVAVDDVPWNRVATGRKAVEDNYRNFFSAFPDARYTSVNRVTQGDIIVDEWLMTGTHKGELTLGKMIVQPTNQRFELRGVNVYGFSGSLVGNVRVYYDALSLARQLGLTQLLQMRAAGQ